MGWHQRGPPHRLYPLAARAPAASVHPELRILSALSSAFHRSRETARGVFLGGAEGVKLGGAKPPEAKKGRAAASRASDDRDSMGCNREEEVSDLYLHLEGNWDN